MPTYRPERIAEMIHRELAQRLVNDIKDPRLVPISITQVAVTRDLRQATVQFLPLGGGDVGPELRDALHDAARRLRGPIGRDLRLRYSPEIVFQVDRHTENALRVSKLLDAVQRERQVREGGDDQVIGAASVADGEE